MTERARLDPLAVPLTGRHLIEASAGTGKTWNIAILFLRLVLERRLAVAQILVVTYTNAATAELRGRIRQRLVEALAFLEGSGEADETLATYLRARIDAGFAEVDRAALGRALYGFDEAAISTIHGACQRILQENAFESGIAFEADLMSDQNALLDDVVRDFWVRSLYDASPVVMACAEKHLGLKKLRNIAGRMSTQPHQVVLPDPPDEGNLQRAVDAGMPIFAEAARLWKSEREAIRGLLGADDLNGRSYGADRAEKWSLELDGYFAAATPAALEFLDKLTPVALEKATKKNRTTPTHPFFEACARLHAALGEIGDGVAAWLVGRRVEFARHVAAELARRKSREAKLYFDDLIERVRGALAAAGGDALAERVAGRFPAALIDEFQDTDPVQYDIFERIFGRGDRTLFLIGDPKQSIYAFRGADVFSYIRAARATEHGHTLTVNYRSDPGVLRGINALFARTDPFFLPDIHYETLAAAPGVVDRLGGAAAGAPPVQLLLLRRPAGEAHSTKGRARAVVARAVAAEVVRFLDSGALLDGEPPHPNDIAVLCRTNREAAMVQAELRELGVPSVLESQESVFDSPEAAEMERIVRALAEPRDARAVVAAISTVTLGCDAAEIEAIQRDPAAWERQVEHFVAGHRRWLEAGFVAAFRGLLDAFEAEARILSYTDGERRLTNLLHLSELLQREAVESHRRPQALAEWLARLRHDARERGARVGDAAEIRLESDARALRLTTIHKSKGLQYPVVFCPFLWNGSEPRTDDECIVTFHDRDDGERAKLALGMPPDARHVELNRGELLAENLRLLYVALTRARHRLTIVWGRVNECDSSPLGYLLHQVDGEMEPSERAAATAARIATLSDADMRRDLEALAERAAGAIEVADLSESAGMPWRGAGETAVTIDHRRFRRRLDLSWRTASFTSMVAGGPIGQAADEGRDRDESDTAVPEPRRAEEPVVLHELPAGARMGVVVHSILERIPFDAGREALLEAAAAELRRGGLEERWAEALAEGLGQALSSALVPAAFTLAEIARDERAVEMEFVLPVAGGTAELTSRSLANVFAGHAGPASRREYVERLARLDFAALRGYLRGYIDLVFRRGERWYVADYKSNRLGARPSDYRPERMLEEMGTHHYFLQYHLYLVALHRHLRLRLPGYDPERHLGGAYYLFVRGMSPAHEPGTGVFFDRPPAALIEALSRAFEGGEGDRP